MPPVTPKRERVEESGMWDLPRDNRWVFPHMPAAERERGGGNRSRRKEARDVKASATVVCPCPSAKDQIHRW